VLSDRGKAERWLADHPKPPDDDPHSGPQGQFIPVFHSATIGTGAAAAIRRLAAVNSQQVSSSE